MRPFAELLREGIDTGQFGGDIEPHGHHALGFVSFSGGGTLTGTVIDMGSGAGLPALVLAEACPDATWVLIERRKGRAELLRRAVRRLGFDDRVQVIADDVADVAHGPWRGQADWVTARSFGPPAETTELAAPLLRVGGSLLTSEPIDGALAERWPAEGVERLGGQPRLLPGIEMLQRRQAAPAIVFSPGVPQPAFAQEPEPRSRVGLRRRQ